MLLQVSHMSMTLLPAALQDVSHNLLLLSAALQDHVVLKVRRALVVNAALQALAVHAAPAVLVVHADPKVPAVNVGLPELAGYVVRVALAVNAELRDRSALWVQKVTPVPLALKVLPDFQALPEPPGSKALRV